MGDGPSLEVESTLVICSSDPEGVANGVASVRAIAGLVLREREALFIVDTYVDLPGDQLAQSGIGLRLRQIGDKVLVTFKGPTREVDGARIREEHEDDWSAPTLADVSARISDYGIRIASAPFDLSCDPILALADLGFTVGQRRQLVRRPRDVLLQPDEDVLAELVVDAVTYRFEGLDIRHHEIEVEVKARGGEVAMHRLIQAIVDTWGARVRPWRHGKLATGRAVAALLASGRLGDLIDGAGRLAPRAYDVIDDWLRSE